MLRDAFNHFRCVIKSSTMLSNVPKPIISPSLLWDKRLASIWIFTKECSLIIFICILCLISFSLTDYIWGKHWRWISYLLIHLEDSFITFSASQTLCCKLTTFQMRIRRRKAKSHSSRWVLWTSKLISGENTTRVNVRFASGLQIF